MKKLLIGSLALMSFTSYASNISFECKYAEDLSGQSRIIAIDFNDDSRTVAIPVVQGRLSFRYNYCPVLASKLNEPIPSGYNSNYEYQYKCTGNSYGAGGTLKLIAYKKKKNGELKKGKVISSFWVETGVNDGAASNYLVCQEYAQHLNKFLRVESLKKNLLSNDF